MARKLEKREWILLGVLSAVAIWVWMNQGGEEPGPSAAAAAAAKEAARRNAPVIRMDLLAHAEPTAEGGMRDLFKFEARPPSPAEVRRQQELERQRQLALKKQQEEEARLAKERELALARQREEELRNPKPPPPPPEPVPPAIPFQYIGLLGPKDAKIGVFEEGKDIVIARVGETVRDQFRLVELKHDAAIIGYTRTEFRNKTKELPMKRR
ncbi:MAG TPA: hypothetical protein VF139_09790 [Candidatus Polarisedimenticolaceae bacterium]